MTGVRLPLILVGLLVASAAYLGVAEASHNCKEVNARTAFLKAIAQEVDDEHPRFDLITKTEGRVYFRGAVAPEPLNCIPTLPLP